MQDTLEQMSEIGSMTAYARDVGMSLTGPTDNPLGSRWVTGDAPVEERCAWHDQAQEDPGEAWARTSAQ